MQLPGGRSINILLEETKNIIGAPNIYFLVQCQCDFFQYCDSNIGAVIALNFVCSILINFFASFFLSIYRLFLIVIVIIVAEKQNLLFLFLLSPLRKSDKFCCCNTSKNNNYKKKAIQKKYCKKKQRWRKIVRVIMWFFSILR